MLARILVAMRSTMRQAAGLLVRCDKLLLLFCRDTEGASATGFGATGSQSDNGKRKARRNFEMRLTDAATGSLRRTTDEQEKSGRGVCRRRRRRRCRRDGGGWVDD